MGKHDEAWMILKKVHDTNMRAKGTPEKVFTVSGGGGSRMPATGTSPLFWFGLLNNNVVM